MSMMDSGHFGTRLFGMDRKNILKFNTIIGNNSGPIQQHAEPNSICLDIFAVFGYNGAR